MGTTSTLNEQQATYFGQITDSLADSKSDINTHVLKGSAGTGKTFLTRKIVGFLLDKGTNVVQVAPTGRAAKNMASGSALQARTIQSAIYKTEQLPAGQGVRFLTKPNDTRQFTVFVVDESSMISDKVSHSEHFHQPGGLLSDLIDYAKRGNADNKFLFIGDPCQLPPVDPDASETEGESPALLTTYLTDKFGLHAQNYFLSVPMRAKSDSYIIENATYIRDCITQQKMPDNQRIKINSTGKSWDTAKLYGRLYDPKNTEKVILIASTNKDVNYWNRNIRKQFGHYQDTLHVGDQVVMNQTWHGEGQTVYNGETGYIRAVGKNEQYAGLTFADVQVEFQGNDGKPILLTAKTMLDTLSTEPEFRGVIDGDIAKNYYAEMHKHTHGHMESSPFYNPLQLRFGYALTCHKAQGSEWDHVIIHRNALYADRLKTSLRWRYTALTRARQDIYTWAA